MSRQSKGLKHEMWNVMSEVVSEPEYSLVPLPSRHYLGARMKTRLNCILILILSICQGCSLQGENLATQLPSTHDEEKYVSFTPTSPPLLDTTTKTETVFQCPEGELPWITDLNVYQTPSLSEPPARKPFRDPVFGTCVIRVTDRMEDISTDDPSPGLKNEYARVQSFNADGSLFLLYGIEGTWYLYDAITLQPIRQIPIETEPRWDSKDPNLLYFLDETRLMAFYISEDEYRVLHDFSLDFPGQQLSAVWTRYEGSPSLDNRYWGLMAEDQDWLTFAYLIYDLQEEKIISMRNLTERIEVDSVTISPLGSFFLAYLDDYCEWDQLGNDNTPCGLMVYDRDLEHGRGLLRIVGHSDVALDAQGNEVLVYQDIDTDFISMLNLASGEITPLWPINFTYSPIGFHFSGRGYELPGWVIVSTYSGSQPAATWMDDQVFALELKSEGRVVRLAHTHSLVDENQDHDYWAEPHASVNQAFTRVIFTTNWGRSGTGEVETYIIELPSDWTSDLP